MKWKILKRRKVPNKQHQTATASNSQVVTRTWLSYSAILSAHFDPLESSWPLEAGRKVQNVFDKKNLGCSKRFSKDVPCLPFLGLKMDGGKGRAGKKHAKGWKNHANLCALCIDDTEAFKAHILRDQWWFVLIFAALEAPCSSGGCDIHNVRNYSAITCTARHVTNISTTWEGGMRKVGVQEGDWRKEVEGTRARDQKWWCSNLKGIVSILVKHWTYLGKVVRTGTLESLKKI